MSPPPDDPFHLWVKQLDERHLADRSFAEVRRSIQALSSRYVSTTGAARCDGVLDGAGKRAAFALYFGPLHFLITRRVVSELGAHVPGPERILDLGCGTGAAGAAWALACPRRPRLNGLDHHPWALTEARWTYRQLELRGRTTRSSAARVRLPGAKSAILAAYCVNELPADEREPLRGRLLAAARKGARLLIVEPIARPITPWWDRWSDAFRAAGGRADEWRFQVELPARLSELARAARLDVKELTARSLYHRGQTRGQSSNSN